jgi:uncharacterized protein (DUF1697 family)
MIIMVYVALLRGINVGGKNKIDMKILKRTFENAGMTDVVTYINSGNIVFTSEETSRDKISWTLESAIYQDFGLQIKVLIVDRTAFDGIIRALPNTWRNDRETRSDVMFLWDEIDGESVLEKLKINPEIDTVKYVPGAILWSVDKKSLSRSGLSKLVGTKVYKMMTVRNVNTVRRIHALMAEGRS